MKSYIHPASNNSNMRIAVSYWLFACVFLVALMVIVGGYTRLSGSGLSITEWKPIHGAIPPLNETQWQEEFESYKQIPQYVAINKGMSLEEFKNIYWPEFWHRNLGRTIGFVFLFPFLFFSYKRAFSKKFGIGLLGVFTLGGFQGAIGWVMVASGLKDRVYVSHVKLAIHLGIAFVLFALLLYAALLAYHSRAADSEKNNCIFTRKARIGFWLILLTLFIQILLGALMAGLHAGLLYPTFPLMNDAAVPAEIFNFYGSYIDNPALIQFLHRYLAKTLVFAYVLWWFFNRECVRNSSGKRWWQLVLVALFVQFALGVLTLVKAVPFTIALNHQAVGLILFGLSIIWLHTINREGK